MAIYYVNGEKGDDSKDGLSYETAWKTFKNINKIKFYPGDQIAIAGTVKDNLIISTSGTLENPIIFSSF